MNAYIFAITLENASMIKAVQQILTSEGYEAYVATSMTATQSKQSITKDALGIIRFVRQYCTKNTTIILTAVAGHFGCLAA